MSLPLEIVGLGKPGVSFGWVGGPTGTFGTSVPCVAVALGLAVVVGSTVPVGWTVPVALALAVGPAVLCGSGKVADLIIIGR